MPEPPPLQDRRSAGDALTEAAPLGVEQLALTAPAPAVEMAPPVVAGRYEILGMLGSGGREPSIARGIASSTSTSL